MNRSKQRLILPLYHTVSNQLLPHLKYLYPVRNENQFREDLDFFLTHFKPLSVVELKDLIDKDKKPEQNSFLLTFDDGLKEVYQIIAPVLEKKGIPAIFFINPGFVDNKDLFFRFKASLLINKLNINPPSGAEYEKIKKTFKNHGIFISDIKKGILSVTYRNKQLLDDLANILGMDYQEYLETNQPYLSIKQIQELSDKGFAIGAHSIDHPEFDKITLMEQLRQTRESLEYIISHFNPGIKLFSMPFTDFGLSGEYFNKVLYSNEPIADISFGTAGLKNDNVKYHLQRIPMEVFSYNAEKLIKQEYLSFLLKKPLGKSRVLRD